MGRRVALLVVVAAGAVAGCRPDTVSLDGQPAVGATVDIRYDIEVEVTRAVEGQAPQRSVRASRLDTEQTVLAVDGHSTLVAMTVRVDDGAPRRLRARLDRAGSLAAVDEVEGLPAGVLGLPDEVPGLVLSDLARPGHRVGVGDEWSVQEVSRRGTARLERLGVVDGRSVATVWARVVQELAESTTVGRSEVAITGRVASSSTIVYDLADGTVRRGSLRATGEVDALVQPPAGVTALPVPASISYEVRVRATRVG